MEADGPARQNCPHCLSWHAVNRTRGEVITNDRLINIYKYLMQYGIQEDHMLNSIPEKTLESANLNTCPRCKEKGINTYYAMDSCPKCNYRYERKEEKKEEKKDGHHKTPKHSPRDGAKGQRKDGTVDATSGERTSDIKDTSVHHELPSGKEEVSS